MLKKLKGRNREAEERTEITVAVKQFQ